MNILVTGAAGFIGSHLCEALLERGDRVIAIDHIDPASAARKKYNLELCHSNPNFIFVDLDIREKKELDWFFYKHKPERVVHLAAKTNLQASLSNPDLFREVNIEGTRNLLDLCVKYKLKGFIFASTSQVYGTSPNIPFSEDDELGTALSPYAETKRQAEGICREYYQKHSLNTTILRFFSVYGPRCRPDIAPYKFIDQLSRDRPLQIYLDQKEFERGIMARDYTYISDAIDGILLALDKNPYFEIFNIARGRPIKLNDLVKLLETLLKTKAKKEFLGRQEGDALIIHADIRKAQRLLGFEPKIPVEEGMKKLLSWYDEAMALSGQTLPDSEIRNL